MTKLTAELGGLRTVTGNLRKLINDHPELAAQALRTSAEHILVPAIRANVKKHKNVFTGEYHSRMTARAAVVAAQTKVALEIGAFGVPYGLNIEKGSPPHTPHEERIREWIRKKGGATGTMANYLTAVITATIESIGTKAYPNIIPAWKANKQKFFKDFQRRMGVALAGVPRKGP